MVTTTEATSIAVSFAPNRRIRRSLRILLCPTCLTFPLLVLCLLCSHSGRARDTSLLDTPALGSVSCGRDVCGYFRLYVAQRTACRTRPGGARKRLTAFLNGYFGKLIELVLAHGGDVVKFAGDALLAVWMAPDLQASLAEATLLAAQCGLAMQEALKAYVAGDARLTLRISIGAGQAAGMLLGSAQGRKEYLLTGWPVAQVIAADKRTKPDDVAPYLRGVCPHRRRLYGGTAS